MRYSKLCIFFLLALNFTACTSTPVDQSELGIFLDGRESGKIPYDTVSVLKIYPGDRSTTDIKGICFVISTPESFFDLPCKSIKLQLFGMNGELVESNQTDDEGRFRFDIKKRGKYRLKVDSKKYRTLSDEIILSSGADTLIRLVRKK